ncbi:hypothetical protein LOC68_16805 [Blastopirellula sp. JC732]|uniref:Uncharacterized protein n=1 Tax=Blastopirellula sediminis TaxID=2894196 RepID=A0A9X1MNS5_9BACT|nr:hypothetical protein [Blastopirellula sediminis]MCC9606649.1 hypothetical protein [Blastopirellula sediminis]MCC9630054.1 hypothetical protein [Blastopirellula sediminis]
MFRIVLTILVLIGSAHLALAGRVTLEVATEKGVPLTSTHKWVQALQSAGFDDVRLRSGNSGDATDIVDKGSGNYHIVALLTPREVLVTPGGQFRLTDVAGMRAWLEKVRAGGKQELQRRESVFGLTSKEFIALFDKLAPAVGVKTKDTTAFETMQAINKRVNIQFRAAPDVVARMRQGKVLDELEAVSCGTAVAAMVRPLGLAMVPRREAGGEVELHIIDSSAAKNPWPVGWAPDGNPGQVAPTMFQYLEVEISDIPVQQATEAIAARVKLPLLWDHNGITAKRIDIATAKVKHPDQRTFYKKLLDTILFQAKLTLEIKVDEAGHAMIWITPLGK